MHSPCEGDTFIRSMLRPPDPISQMHTRKAALVPLPRQRATSPSTHPPSLESYASVLLDGAVAAPFAVRDVTVAISGPLTIIVSAASYVMLHGSSTV